MRDLEWVMHYQIAANDTHLYFGADLTNKPSGVPSSKLLPNMEPGTGLFTEVPRKKNDLLCEFPGYWVERHMFGTKAHNDGHYAFSLSKDSGWDTMEELVYVTHTCQANFINSAIVGDEVLLHHQATTCYVKQRECMLIKFVLRVQVVGELNVRFQFGNGSRGDDQKEGDELLAECLIGVYATKDIKAGAELLGQYGDAFWSGAAK